MNFNYCFSCNVHVHRWFTADPASISIEQVALTLREAKVSVINFFIFQCLCLMCLCHSAVTTVVPKALKTVI